MSGYVCIAMLEDPPYSIYLAATEEEPEDWCAGLSLPSTLLCHGAFQDPEMIANALVKTLQAAGIKATTERAFKAPPAGVIEQFMKIRDAALQEKPGNTLREHGRKANNKENFRRKDAGLALYEQAEDLELDDPKRLALLKEAAELGYEPAIDEALTAYENGWGCNNGSLEEVYNWIIEHNIKVDNNRIWDLVHRCYPTCDTDITRRVEFKILKNLALSGHQESILAVATEYYSSTFVDQDCREALLWADKLTKDNIKQSDIKDVDEMYYDLGDLYYDIASLYEKGNDKIIPDIKKAFKLFKKSAEFQYPPAYLALSLAYLAGNGVRKDINEAIYWAKKDKDTGSEYGYSQLARCYIDAGRKEQAAEVWKQCFRELDIDRISRILYLYALDVTKRSLPQVHTDTISQQFDVAIHTLQDMDESNLKEHGVRIYKDTIAWLENNKLSHASHGMAKIDKDSEKPISAAQTAHHVRLETSLGNVVFQLNAEKAPVTVENFLGYVRDGFYNGTVFHRVIPDFMVQGGGFTERWEQKTHKSAIKNEANNGLPNRRGSIAMARTSDPQSATAQFFINLADNAFLDYQSPSPEGWGYAVFGEVVQGMDIVDRMATIPTGASGPMPSDVPKTPIVIKRATLVVE